MLDGAIRRYKSDGREICEPNAKGKAEYLHRVECMWLRQQQTCGLCGQPMLLSDATFEHEDLRGAGGSRRQDAVVLENGVMINLAAHGWCNTKKGSRRINECES